VSRRRDSNADRSVHRRPGPPRDHRVVYVAVEGERTEVDYFNYIKDTLADARITLHILAEPNGMNRSTSSASWSTRMTRRGTLGGVRPRSARRHTGGLQDRANRNGVNVAFCHPSFDLWLLLHFQSFSGAQSGSTVVVREQLNQYPGFEGFGAHDKRLDARRVAALRGNEASAIRQGRKLAEDCPTTSCVSGPEHAEHCDPLNRDPSADVWRLLEALGIPVSE